MYHTITREKLGGDSQTFTAGSWEERLDIDTTLAACGRDSTNTDIGDTLLRIGCNGHTVQMLIARDAGKIVARSVTMATKDYGSYTAGTGIYTLSFMMQDVPVEVLLDGTLVIRVPMNEARSRLTQFRYLSVRSTTEYEPPGLIIYRTDEISTRIRNGLGGAIEVTIKP